MDQSGRWNGRLGADSITADTVDQSRTLVRHTHFDILPLRCRGDGELAMCFRYAVMGLALLGAVYGAEAATPDVQPVAHVSFDGPSLAFDFPALRIGVAEYEEGPTGATVIVFNKPVMAAVDVRGGAPGTLNTDLLRLGLDAPVVNAITLSGGSAYGLAVATGVANALKKRAKDPGNWKN